MKRLLATLLCFAALLSAAACAAPPVSEPVETTEATEPTETTEVTETTGSVFSEEFKGKLDALLARNNFEGIVCLTHKGSVVYQSVSGTNELGEPLAIDSPMYIGSISKQFCAAAILMLRDQGKLSVEDTLDKYFPEYEIGKDITLKNLLAMRSGIPDFANNFHNIQFEDSEDGIATLKEWLFRQSLKFEPDKGYTYCNTNYVLLALVVEQVSGQSYEQFIRQNILEPLGMTHTGFVLEVRENPSWAAGLTYDTFEAEADVPEIVKGAGDLVTTAADIDVWMTALSSGAVISMDSYREMTTNHSPEFNTYYGYGISAMTEGGFGHTGGIGSYSSLIYFDAASGYNLYAVTNKPNPMLEALAQSIIRRLPSTDEF